MEAIKKQFFGPNRFLLIFASVSVGYYLSALLGLSLAIEQSNTSPVWPPSGVAVAAILLAGFRIWPAIFLGAFLVNFFNPTPFLPSLAIATGNTLEAVVGCYLLVKITHERGPLGSVINFLAFVGLTVLFASMISATIGVSTLVFSELATIAQFSSLWIIWWLGDASGMILVAPLLLVWLKQYSIQWSTAKNIEAGAMFLASVVLAELVFGRYAQTGFFGFLIGYLLIPVLAWSVFRFGFRGITAITTTVYLIAIVGTAEGQGPFLQANMSESILLLQSFMATIIITGLVTAILLTERRNALTDLKDAQNGLEKKVRDRTEELETVNTALSKSEANWRAINQNTPDHILALKPDGEIQFINHTVAGINVDQAIGTKVYDHIDEQSGERLRSCIQKVVNSGNPEIVETSYEGESGVIRFENRINAVKKGEKVVSLIMSSRDMTERKRAENIIGTLAEQSLTNLQDDTFFYECVANLADFYRSRYAFIGLLEEPKRDRVRTYAVWAGDRLVENFEYDLVGTPCEDVLDLRKQLIPRNVAKHYPEDKMLVDMNIEGYFGAPLVTQAGDMIGLVSVMGDTELDPPEWAKPIIDIFAHRIAIEMDRKQAQEVLHTMADKMSYQATHDPLTDLINRREFESRLSIAMEKAANDGAHHALCYLDLDQFKVVNDTCGHLAGDELLKHLAAKIEAVIRDSDTIARLGGDEFGVLLQDCPLERALQISYKILATVREYRFRWDDKTFEIGVSVGLVPIDANSGSLVEIMSDADSACYVAKELGRNRVHVYTHDDTDLSRRKGEMQWVAKIPTAIEENRFCLYKQSIVPTFENGHDGFAEILVRLQDDDDKLLQPVSFVNAAERYNLMPSIDRWVIENVFSYVSSHADGVQYCVNLSGTTLSDGSLTEFVSNTLEKYAIKPSQICFEITETAAITHIKLAKKLIRNLKQLGFSFALDDFGTGLSSYAYLKDLPVDYLKIDGNFVKGLDNNAANLAIVESINQIGHSMGIQTIAEWVESESACEELKRIGVDYVQGYWIERPQFLV